MDDHQSQSETADDGDRGLVLYDTLTREKRPFRPIDPKAVRMYVCGPTVYDDAHIGNARPLIVFDVLFRLLRHLYGPKHVTYVRNVTDVDDKINARAAKRGISIRALTDGTLAQFQKDAAALGCLPPSVEPRATDHIEDMKAMIERLVAAGNAYVKDDHVLFDVASFPGYGALARRSLDEMRAGARVEVAPWKRGDMDFVLWKPSDPDKGEPGWPSPCGIGRAGRPGWHIECSAMSDVFLWEGVRDRLGPEGLSEPHRFDIHGGGIDLSFPHHENELAQTRCAFDAPAMSNYWLHNGFLQVEGRKMAKSEGNFVTIRALLADWPGDVLRLNMLKTHYRQPIDWTVKGLEESTRNLADFAEVAAGAVSARLDEEAMLALSDDLNTPRAVAALHSAANDGRTESLSGTAALLGIDLIAVADRRSANREARLATVDVDVAALVAERLDARKRRDFGASDRIRDELAAKGIVLKDGKDPETGEPTTSWEVAS